MGTCRRPLRDPARCQKAWSPALALLNERETENFDLEEGAARDTRGGQISRATNEPTRFPGLPDVRGPGPAANGTAQAPGDLKRLQTPSRAQSSGPGAAVTGSPRSCDAGGCGGARPALCVYFGGARRRWAHRLVHGRRWPRSHGPHRHRSCLIKQLVSRTARRDETRRPRSRARRPPLLTPAGLGHA